MLFNMKSFKAFRATCCSLSIYGINPVVKQHYLGGLHAHARMQIPFAYLRKHLRQQWIKLLLFETC